METIFRDPDLQARRGREGTRVRAPSSFEARRHSRLLLVCSVSLATASGLGGDTGCAEPGRGPKEGGRGGPTLVLTGLVTPRGGWAFLRSIAISEQPLGSLEGFHGNGGFGALSVHLTSCRARSGRGGSTVLSELDILGPVSLTSFLERQCHLIIGN